MQGRKRDRDDRGLKVAVTAHQLLQPPVLPHHVVPLLLRRTVASYLPVIINAPEEAADVDAHAAEELRRIAASTVQRGDAQRRQPRLLAGLLRSVLVPPCDPTPSENEYPNGNKHQARKGVWKSAPGTAKAQSDDTEDSDDTSSGDSWTVGYGDDFLEMDPDRIELARSTFPTAVLHERWVYRKTNAEVMPSSEGFLISVVIEGKRAVAVASMSQQEDFTARHYFALGPADAPFHFEDDMVAAGCFWAGGVKPRSSQPALTKAGPAGPQNREHG